MKVPGERTSLKERARDHRCIGPRPRHRPATAGEPVPLLYPHPAGLGRRRVLRQADRLAVGPKIRPEIVRKRDARAFEALPRRWVVKCTLTWITTHRRCARDYERLPESHHAIVLWAMIALMTQRLAEGNRTLNQTLT